jgi:rhamnulokinase
MQAEAVVAVDLGASSGRCWLVRYDGIRLTSEKLHEFPNHPIRFNGHLRWNVAQLLEETKVGLSAAARQPIPVCSVAIDSWGVDFGLLGANDTLLDLPISYRDSAISGCMERVCEALGRDRIYTETGIQFLPFNTLYQLYARNERSKEALRSSRHLLMIPDLFVFLLTGEKISEYTNASTTQMLALRSGAWSELLTRFLDVPIGVLPPIAQPATQVSKLTNDIVAETGLSEATITLTASHDTASAIAAIPALEGNWAYMSCGTWSLVGQELSSPNTSAEALARNFTNEAGVAGTTRFLKNVQGMWLLQECQREWAARGAVMSAESLVRGAKGAPPFAFFIDPDDSTLMNPGSMLQSIEQYCRRTGQKFNPDPLVVARGIFESLALKHRRTVASAAELTGITAQTIHIVGGGSRNRLLCQWTADATGTAVIAGPAEATVIGNAAVQGMALGWFADLKSARTTIARSVKLVNYRPRYTEVWDVAEQRFDEIVARALQNAVHA